MLSPDSYRVAWDVVVHFKIHFKTLSLIQIFCNPCLLAAKADLGGTSNLNY